MEINFRPIGVVKTQASKDEVSEKGDDEGELEIYPEFADGLDGKGKVTESKSKETLQRIIDSAHIIFAVRRE